MAKKTKHVNEEKPLSKEEVSKYKPEDQTAKLQTVMGFDLTTAYKVGLELNSDNPAVVAKQVAPDSKNANVDSLPTSKQ